MQKRKIFLPKTVKCFSGYVFLLSNILLVETANSQTTTTIPSSPPAISQPVAPAVNHGKLIDVILDNLKLNIIYKCTQKIKKDVDREISIKQSKIKKLTKFNLLINYTDCSAEIRPYTAGPYLLAEDSRITTLELLPLTSLLGNSDTNIFIIFPKKDSKVTGDYFKLEGVTREMWKITKKHILKDMLQEKYQTTDYTHAKLKKGHCGVVYSNTSKSGQLRMYFANYIKNETEAQKTATDKRKFKHRVLEVICNS